MNLLAPAQSIARRSSHLRGRRVVPLVVGIALVLAACGSPPTGTPSAADGTRQRPAGQPRTLVMIDRHEPLALHEKVLAAGTSGTARRLFNAYLAANNDHGAPLPYLAESLPELHTDSWRVFPDGRMETIYRLRPGLTWQDGTPLTVEDFVFAYSVYTDPVLAIFSTTPQNLVEEIATPDPRTLVFRWRSTYPDAGDLVGNTLEPLPRHLLEPAYQAVKADPAARDTFLNLPFWTTQYIGAGPYRLDRWSPGIQIEASAFDGHVLGRPKIDRIIYKFITDENTILSNVLAGEAQFTTSTSLRVNQAQVLKREWGPTNKGTVLYVRNSVFYNHVQFRPDFQKTAALLDLRVRQAMAHSIDKQGVIDVLFEGDSTPAHTFIALNEPEFAAVDRAIMKYAYDPRRTEQLMNEAGFTKDRDGLFADARGARFAPDFEALEGADYERAGQIISDGWRRAGIDVQYTVLPNVMIRDNERRHKAPGITSPGAGQGNARAALSQWSSSEIGVASGRWTGSNRGGWSNADFDRQSELFNVTLEQADRNEIVAQAMKIMSDQLPGFPVYYNIYPLAVAGALSGPTSGASSETVYWNIQDWQLN